MLGNLIGPNVRWFGYVIWFSELAVFVLLFLGLFTRMNGFFALSISAQLMIGLAPGRIFGLDALIRKWAAPTAQRDNVVAKLVMLVS